MRNLLLLLTLIGMILLVYFFEEKKTVNEMEERTKREELFNVKTLGDLKSLKSSILEINFENNKIISENGIEVSSKKVDEFLQSLQKIHVQRIFTSDEVKEMGEFKTHAQFNLKFSSGLIRLELGAPLSFDTSFYLKIVTEKSEKIVLARYTGELLANITIDPTSVNEKNKNLAPWSELKRLLGLTSHYFWVDNPFEELEVKKITIKTFRSPEYEIDFVEKRTKPEILSGLLYQEASFEEYLRKIKSIKSLNVEKMGLVPLEEIATLQIGSENVSIYKKYLGRSGYFLRRDDVIFEINGDDFRNLISPVQHFWNKKLNISQNDEIRVFDKKEKLILKTKLSLANSWSRFLKEEAYSVSHRSFDTKKSDFIVRQNQSVFHVLKSEEGTEVYDMKNQLLYLFLTKLE